MTISARKITPKRRRAVVESAMAKPAFTPHDADDSPDDKMLRALRAEQRRRPEWALVSLAGAGKLSPELIATANRIMAMVDRLEPRGGSALGEPAGARGFDPGDAEKVFRGEKALGPAHAAQIKRGLIARDIATLRAAARAKLGIHDERTFWLAFGAIRPSVAEIRAARAVTYADVCRIMETGLVKAHAALAKLTEDKSGVATATKLHAA